MGMQMFTSSGTFRPADWGLKAGDMVQVVVVGGGGGGAKPLNGNDGGAGGEGGKGPRSGGSGGSCGRDSAAAGGG